MLRAARAHAAVAFAPGRLLPQSRFTSSVPAGALVPGFARLGLRPELVAAAESLGARAPTEVQERSIPAALRGENVLATSPTGSGKTLCMLLPLFHCMKADETVLRLASRPSRPRALVLSPTRELAQQTLGVAKSLSHHCRARVVGITGGAKRGRQVAALADAQGVDVVVGTPGRLLQLQQAGSLSLADVRYIAIDEADSMLLDDVLDAPASQREDGEGSERESFSGETGRLLLPVLRALRAGDAFTGSGAPRSPPPGPFDPTLPVERCVQFLLAAATVAPSAEAALQRRIPGGVSIIRARGTHACPSQLEARFVRVGSGPEAEFGDKMDALHAELARAASNAGRSRAAGRGGGSAGGGHRTIVFCGTIQSARAVAKEAQGRGWLVASLHGGIPPQLRAAEFRAAITGERPVLVATDAAARGLDLSGADDVIMFDFPRTGEDFIHRAGRTARAGRQGRLVCLVGPRERDQARLAERALREGRPVLDAWGGTTRRGAGAEPGSGAGAAAERRGGGGGGGGGGGASGGRADSPATPSGRRHTSAHPGRAGAAPQRGDGKRPGTPPPHGSGPQGRGPDDRVAAARRPGGAGRPAGRRQPRDEWTAPRVKRDAPLAERRRRRAKRA